MHKYPQSLQESAEQIAQALGRIEESMANQPGSSTPPQAYWNMKPQESSSDSAVELLTDALTVIREAYLIANSLGTPTPSSRSQKSRLDLMSMASEIEAWLVAR